MSEFGLAVTIFFVGLVMVIVTLIMIVKGHRDTQRGNRGF